MNTLNEDKSVRVPAGDSPIEEDLWQRYKAERKVWTKPMLAALEGGMKERKWYSLSDKICAESTLELAWEKVRANAGACGVDGITIEHFGKDSINRLLAVRAPKQRLLSTQAGQTGLDTKTGEYGEASIGDTHGC
mgnify:CR=1 FL=1